MSRLGTEEVSFEKKAFLLKWKKEINFKTIEFPLRMCSKPKRTSVVLDDTLKISLRVLLSKCSAKGMGLCAIKGGLGWFPWAGDT